MYAGLDPIPALAAGQHRPSLDEMEALEESRNHTQWVTSSCILRMSKAGGHMGGRFRGVDDVVRRGLAPHAEHHNGHSCSRRRQIDARTSSSSDAVCAGSMMSSIADHAPRPWDPAFDGSEERREVDGYELGPISDSIAMQNSSASQTKKRREMH